MVASKIIRPKGGFETRKGWTVASGDPPCCFCKQPAALLNPAGTPAHPTCVDMERERRRNEEL